MLFSCSVMSNFLWPHELQHARLHGPSPSAGACPNSCPMSRWYHPTISSTAVLFSTCLLSFPASGSFPVSQCVTSGGLPCLKLSFSWLFLLALVSLVFLDKGIETRNKQMRLCKTKKTKKQNPCKRKPLSKWKDHLLNGRKYLQMIYLIKI